MKRILVLIVITVSLSSKAQDLWVYSTNGRVEIYSAASWSPAETYRKLDLTDSIRFGANSSVTLLDRKNDRIYAIQKDGCHSVQSLVSDAQKRSNKQSKDIVSYLWKSLRGKNSDDEFRRPAGVVYRNEDVNAVIANAVITRSSALPVEFDLLDEKTGYSIGEMATVGNSALVKVKNHSSQDLFVNLIDVDVSGNIAPCIPVSSAQQMMQLFIPAGAEVMLDSFPIVFAEPRGEDKLILVASPDLFDINAVIAGINEKNLSAGNNKEVGVFVHRLMVK